MDIIFQLTGSVLLCYYVMKRNTKDFIKQSYDRMSKGSFEYDRTYTFILETYLARIGILYITVGYIFTIFKVPNYLLKYGFSNLLFHALSLFSVLCLTFVSFFIVKRLAIIKSKNLQKKFDFSRYMEEGETYIYFKNLKEQKET